LNILKNSKNIYFANILDGDEAHSNMPKFEYMLSLSSIENIKNKVYVGDLKGFYDWFKNTFVDK
jgi:hypothetical protein